MLKRMLLGGLYVCYLLLILYAVFYFGFWTTYQKILLETESPATARERLEPPRHIDSGTMRLLGSVYQTKISSFVNFEQAKPPGTIRVCAIGDSNTQGDEVGLRHDYPSYLQRLFKQRGFDRVEVLNFGNGWYGFSQIYVMWKNVASKFDCDFVLLLPMDFWIGRDNTFNHTNGQFPDYLHARLVLESNNLRLVAPNGTTAEERLKEYVRPIPHWQYLRYDRHPPNILNSPLPRGRNLPNPFYYDPRPGSEEFVDIYAKILRAIADDGPQVVVVFRGKHRNLYPGIVPTEGTDIGVALLSETRRFPYLAPAGHPSGWGQEVTAWGFFEILTGSVRSDFSLATIKDITASTTGAPKALHSYQQVWLEYLGERTGYFVNTIEKSLDNHAAHVRIFKRQKIAAILALETPGGNIAEACLLPLQAVPADNAELVFSSDDGDRNLLSFGVVHQIQPEVAIFKATAPYAFNITCLPNSNSENTQTIHNGALMLDHMVIAKIEGERILPEQGLMLKLAESGEQLASIESLATPGVMDIVLKNDDGTVVRRPLIAVDRQVSQNYMEITHPIKDVVKIRPD